MVNEQRFLLDGSVRDEAVCGDLVTGYAERGERGERKQSLGGLHRSVFVSARVCVGRRGTSSAHVGTRRLYVVVS